MQEEKLPIEILETNLNLGVVDVPIKKKDARFTSGYKVVGYEPKVAFTGNIVVKDNIGNIKVGDYLTTLKFGVFRVTRKAFDKCWCLPIQMTTIISSLPNLNDYRVCYIGRVYGESNH